MLQFLDGEVPSPADPVPAIACPLPGTSLAAFGERTALVTEDGEITYRKLAERVERAAAELGDRRRLVLVTGTNSVDAVVGYLGALVGGHAVMLTADHDAVIGSLTDAYDPDVVCRPQHGRWSCVERRTGSVHDLHPDLALLLTTSGSTGSPKLVRLSHDNLRANAQSIADYLDIRPTDRAATSLPLHYCYGLSVLHSHLVRGAGLILTGRSVADLAFWELFRRARGTSLAGVPYTFTLLDRVGFDTMDLPDLRYVTQAGGRMAPDQVRRFAELGRRRGFQLFIMYGQTEATARMAYLPPERALTSPGAIGVPVPGGALRLAPVDDAPTGVGELVYNGLNVMLGYAETPADLSLGRTVGELFTGDLARQNEDGLFEIVGRRNRFAKVFGLRIGLQRVEAGLEAHGVQACCVAIDDALVVAVEGAEDREDLPRLIAARCGLPVRAVRVVPMPELPRQAPGKVDVQAVAAAAAVAVEATEPPADTSTMDLRALFAEVLDRADVTDDDSFVSLGGDSLSYVEMSVRLEQLLGPLPQDWQDKPIRWLRARTAPVRRRRVRTLDSSVAVRAVAIVLVVISHIGISSFHGSAHLLLVVAGFNFGRFHVTNAPRRLRIRHIAASVARIAIPSSIFLAFVVPNDSRYNWYHVVLLDEAFGPRTGQGGEYWFVETLVYTMLAMLALLSVPLVDRWERRLPFLLPIGLLAVALTTRFHLVEISLVTHFSTPTLLFWYFALGWVVAKARAPWQRVVVTALGIVPICGFFDPSRHNMIILVGFLLLIWLPNLPSLPVLNRLAATLASASLYIYLTHWVVYPHLRIYSPWLALVVALVAGVLYHHGVDWTTRTVREQVSLRLPSVRARWQALATRFPRRMPADQVGMG
ncbi:AMP-binding protein [Krasilnikovia sp. MM14-A1259]|uniref:AMP-binding protein n=1 Tax=Krasilnikovia sp. MM14-A1259 TaxID=3373539 RepID=UPI003825996F